MQITLAESNQFDLVSEGGRQQSVCVCGGDSKPIVYRIIPRKLGQMPIEGEIDTITLTIKMQF